jgi:hypothetical protein
MKKEDSSMNTTVSDSMSRFEDEEEDVTIVRYVSVKNPERPLNPSLRAVVKAFGLLSTIAWGAAALFPETLRIPVPLQGWVFLVSILWFFAYCAGFFNL